MKFKKHDIILVKFPFSNSSPIELFMSMEEYAKENAESWAEKSGLIAAKQVKIRYGK